MFIYAYIQLIVNGLLAEPHPSGDCRRFQPLFVVENFQLLPFLLRHVVRHISASPIEFHPRLAPWVVLL